MARVYPPEFREKLVKEYKAGAKMKDLSKTYSINESLGYNWVRKYDDTKNPKRVKRAYTKRTGQGPVTSGAAERADGRLEMYVKGDRAKLLQIIGEMVVEARGLKKGA